MVDLPGHWMRWQHIIICTIDIFYFYKLDEVTGKTFERISSFLCGKYSTAGIYESVKHCTEVYLSFVLKKYITFLNPG
jgi:hypothetical protein